MRYRNKDLLLAAAFGWLSGMRSMAGPATAGRKLVKDPHIADLLAVGAAGEMLVDKHPATPNRNAPAPLAGRVMMGALTGASIVVSGAGWRPGAHLRSRRYRHRLSEGETLEAAAAGAVIGGTIAFISTHVSYHMRRYIGERTSLPNVALGAAEDVVVYATAIALADNLD
jgi:hypothetical protein